MKHRRKVNFMVFSFLLLLSGAVLSSSYEGKIKEVWVNGQSVQNVGWIYVEGQIQNNACPNNKWFALDLTDETMKSALSFALAAHIANKTVMLQGNGQCLSTNYEYLKLIAVK